MSRRKEPAIPNELLDQLLAGGAASAAFEQGGLLDSLKKALTERALNAEMDHHLAGDEGAGNTRIGYGRKTVVTETGKLEIDVPRDRQSSFDPQLIAKYQRRFPGFDDKIVSLYARGMSTREITGHLRDLYCSVPGCDRPDLHCPPATQLDGLRVLEGPQGSGDGAQGDLPRHGCRRCRKGADRVRGRPLGQRYPAIGQSWRRAWGEVILFFAFPDDVRRAG